MNGFIVRELSTNCTFRVYSVHKAETKTYFLIYKDNHFVWKDMRKFEPIETDVFAGC